MNTAPPPRSRIGLDRPIFAAWTFAVLLLGDVVLFLAGPRILARGEMLALVHVGAASVFTFALFGVDKYRSTRDARRVAESNLLALAWLGGAPGAVLGMAAFRHKTRKAVFRFGIPAALFAQIVVVGWWWIS